MQPNATPISHENNSQCFFFPLLFSSVFFFFFSVSLPFFFHVFSFISSQTPAPSRCPSSPRGLSETSRPLGKALMARPHAVDAVHLQRVLLVLGAPALAAVERAGLPGGGVLDGGAAGGGVDLGVVRLEGGLLLLLFLFLFLLLLLGCE
ncbi:hypothetical protein J3F83DRAFT_376162 [Trichoderma novae-zelandiae]